MTEFLVSNISYIKKFI